jgi:hypothetical protein
MVRLRRSKRGVLSPLEGRVARKKGVLAGNRGVKEYGWGRVAAKTRGRAPKRPPLSHEGQPPPHGANPFHMRDGRPPSKKGHRGRPPNTTASCLEGGHGTLQVFPGSSLAHGNGGLTNIPIDRYGSTCLKDTV